jgi:hypothetical protein
MRERTISEQMFQRAQSFRNAQAAVAANEPWFARPRSISVHGIEGSGERSHRGPAGNQESVTHQLCTTLRIISTDPTGWNLPDEASLLRYERLARDGQNDPVAATRR